MRLSIFFVSFLVSVNHLDGQRWSDNSRFNFFDTDLLRFSAEDKEGNVVVSPASIKSTLAMILEGAGGATAVEIRSALRLSPNKDEFREQLGFYLSALQDNSSSGIINNVNAAFVSDKLKLQKEYEIMLQRAYLTEVYKMDLRNASYAANAINDWVNNMTRGLIPNIIDEGNIGPNTEMVLANALYFKSLWQHSFDSRDTRGACFYHLGLCRQVAMMELHAELNYAFVDNLRAHAIELPYQGGRYSMVLLVPLDRDGLPALIRDLPYMSLPQISLLFEPTDVSLMMPRFTIDYNEDLVDVLRAIRITSLFSSTANLSGIFVGESPQVNNFFHRVHISVDEAGTVAAAATAAMVIPLIQSGVQLRVDRPFVFFIRDNRQALVLFEGKIDAPTTFMDSNAGPPVKNEGKKNGKARATTRF